MQKETTYELTPTLLKLVMSRIFWHRNKRAFMLSWVLAAFLVFTLFASQGSPKWPLYIFFFPAIRFSLEWWGGYRVANSYANSPDRCITVKIETESLTIQTHDFTTIHKWSRVKEVWEFSDMFICFLPEARFAIFPIKAPDTDLRSFLENKIGKSSRLA